MGKFVLFCGSTGVGKTMIFRELERLGKGEVVYCYTDRPPRENDKEKVCVSREKFDSLEEQEAFCSVNHVYGFRYGTPKEALELAIFRSTLALLDVPLDQAYKLADYQPYVFYVMAPSISELRRRLTEGGRTERADEAVRQTEWFLREGFRRYHAIVREILINESVEVSAQRVLEAVKD